MTGEPEGSCMLDNGPILVTEAAGQVGAVERTVTGLLLEREFPVRAMRLSRVRFTVRLLMIAVAAVALLMACGVGLQRRSVHLRQLSLLQSREASRWDLLLTERSVNNPLASAILDKVHWHDDMAARYERAARSRWLPIEAGRSAPIAPELPAELATKYHTSGNIASLPP
jgi:hypothetical protein